MIFQILIFINVEVFRSRVEVLGFPKGTEFCDGRRCGGVDEGCCFAVGGAFCEVVGEGWWLGGCHCDLGMGIEGGRLNWIG